MPYRPSLCWVEKKKKLPPKCHLHILWLMAMFCIAFWFSAWNLQKQKNTNKIWVLPPPQSHTLSKIFEEVSSGPEINTFITDNRHLIKNNNTVNKCLHQLGIKKLGQPEVCAASATVSQSFCRNRTSKYKQITFTVKTSGYLAYMSKKNDPKTTFTRFKKRQH